ncbi:MAG TPA: hypothetical protein DEG09_08705, partial [Marinilabiliaceae bacterium]|nr:hypothetical protein [Marinilabiliaceae bacterium]
LPLKLTPPGLYFDNNMSHRYQVWPEENRIDLPLELLQQVKLRRNDAMRAANSSVRLTEEYPWYDPDKPSNKVSIKGNPNLANVKTVM